MEGVSAGAESSLKRLHSHRPFEFPTQGSGMFRVRRWLRGDPGWPDLHPPAWGHPGLVLGDTFFWWKVSLHFVTKLGLEQ